jgi:hypothetical protein
MVSDTLSDAVEEIAEYLSDDFYGHPGEDLYDRIVAVMNVMDAMRAELDDRSGTPRLSVVFDAVTHRLLEVRFLHPDLTTAGV